MTDCLRLRQICLAAPRIAPVVEDLEAIFQVAVCYRDPNVAHYGLENALIPFGLNFLEVVAPTRPDTAAGRFINRSRGHGGYMAIFQTPDPRRRQAHAASMGVRTAHFIDREAYQSAQLHPRDCRAAFIEFGHSAGNADMTGAWWPAGQHWQGFVRTESTHGLSAIILESPHAAELARHWATILELPLSDRNGASCLSPQGCDILFEHGQTECLGTVVVNVVNPSTTLDRAVDRGLRVTHDTFHLAGVNFRIQQQAQP